MTTPTIQSTDWLCPRCGRVNAPVVPCCPCGQHEPHEGTPDSIREANGRLRARLDDLHPTWSNVMTRTGATNAQAHPQWAVSPNSRNVYEVGTQEAHDLMGWTSTPTAPRQRIGGG